MNMIRFYSFMKSNIGRTRIIHFAEVVGLQLSSFVACISVGGGAKERGKREERGSRSSETTVIIESS